MENTRRLLVLLILTSVLLAGCVKIDLGFKVGAKGRGDASVALDFSRMAESSQQKGSSATGLGLSLDSLKKDKICGTLSDSNSGSGASTSVALGGGLSLSDAKCTATADYKARFDWKNVDLVDANLVKVQTEKGLKIYTFELKNAHAMDSITQSNAQLSNPLLLKAAGFGFSVFVEMPGSVESASAGSISWDRKSVSVDLVDNPDALSKGIRIVSTDAPQTPWLLIGVLIILTLLVGGAVYWFGIKKNPIPFLDARVRPSPPQAAAVPEQQAGEPERFSAPRDFDSFAQPEFAPTRTEGLSPAGGFSFSFDGLIETLRDAYFAVEDRYYELLDRVDARVPVYSVIDPIDQYVPSMVLLLAIGLLLLGGIGWLALGSNGGGIAGRSAVHDVMIGTPAAHLADNSASTGGPRNRDGSSTTPPRPATELGEIKVFTLQFKDSTTKKLLENRTVSFSATCTPGNTALDPRDSTTGSMTIRVPQTCGVLNMVINANDFEPYFESLKFKDLNFSTKVVFLHPLPPAPKTRFTVKVTAVDGANHPVKNVTVRIFKKASADSDLLAVADEGVSQEDGVVALLVSVGGFVVTGFDALTGRFGVTAIQVSADQELRLELNEQGDKKALFVRVVNANTQSGVSDATLRFFLGNTLLTTGTTNAKGEFLQEVVVPTNAGTLRVVVIKPDFVTKIASASFVNIQKPQPVVITLVALTPTNAGKIRVHAFDQTTELSLPDTSVNVFSVQYRIPIIAAPVKTDMDGNALFERLPAASYDVLFAHDGFVDARAAGAAVVGGKTAFVVQGLGHGNGKIRVDVVDSESRSAVDGADVNAYNANSGKLLAGPFQTNAGIVLFEGLDVTVPVYFRVAKSGFVTHTTVYYNALLNGTKSVKVKLTPLSSAVLGLQTGSVYNADRTGLAPSLEPGKSYWIPFSMVLPHDHTAFSQVQTFVQTDGGTDFRIENVDGALVPVSTRFSSQANADGFADTLATAVPANDEQHRGRQVNQLWGDLDSGEYDFWVKVSLPDSASATQRLKFGVKAFDPQKTGGAGFDQKTDSQEYALHQSLCTVGCSEDQIQWEVLVAKDGSPKPGAESPYQLQKGQVYSVWLRIRNTTPDSYNSTMIQVSSDPALTLTFPTGKVFPEEFGPVVLPANDVYQSSNWLFKFRADTTSNLATMDFLTKPITNLTGAAHPVSFKVNDDKQLKVELFSVPLDSRLFVDVMDAVSGAPVISTIRIKRNATASEIANPSTITGWETPVAGNSSFTFENFSMLAGEKALIQASATSYETKNVVLDGSEFNTYRLATGFDCIKTTWWPDWTNSKDPAVQMDASQPLRPALVSGITGEDQKSVSIDAQACKEPMDVKLLVFGSLTDLDFGAGVSMERGQQSPSSISVKLNGTLQGVIPIGVWVKRRSDSEWQLKELHEIYSLVKDAKTDVYG